MGAGLLLARLQPRTICFEAPAYFGICFSLESCTIVLRKARNAQEGERRISGGRVPSIFRLILISSVQPPYLRSTGKTNMEWYFAAVMHLLFLLRDARWGLTVLRSGYERSPRVDGG